MIQQLKYVYIFVLFFACTEVFSQGSLSNLRTRCVPIAVGDTLVLEDRSIEASSFKVLSGKAVFELFSWQGKLLFLSNPENEDSLCVSYRIFPKTFASSYYHKPLSLIQDTLLPDLNPLLYQQKNQNTGGVSLLEGLTKSGAITRGIRSGSNQGLSFDSGLDLQFSGRIDAETEIKGVVSDRNLPVQADGYTQQLQEFDQVYLQLIRPNALWTAGDFIVQEKDQYYGRYRKKASGLYYQSKEDTSRIWSAETSLSLSRGKFSRNVFRALEGNQGPYRLKGAENEPFIIILSGSERVYIDGILMKRGLNYDYVIDYNSAEITFTTNQIMTQNRRIIVEFEYASRNYARFFSHAKIGFQNDKMNWRVQAVSQQDAKNQTIQQSLSPEQKIALALAGDDPSQATQLAIDSVGYDPNAIRYEKRDSLGYTYFRYSTDPNSAVFALSFSQVGFGNGDYILTDLPVNGRVFEWVAPINGQSQGSYAPVRILVTPVKQQLISASGELKLAEKTLMNVDLALSNFDKNTFSNKDANDNVGAAIKWSADQLFDIGKNKLSLQPMFELVQSNFKALERFRTVEFMRDYNVADSLFKQDQLLYGAAVKWIFSPDNYVDYSLRSIAFGSDYKALYQSAIVEQLSDIWELKLKLSQNKAEVGALQSNFSRLKGNAIRKFRPFNLFTAWEVERNQLTMSEAYNPASFFFADWKFGLQKEVDNGAKYQLSYGQRLDQIADTNGFVDLSMAKQAELGFQLGKPGKLIKVQSTYRSLEARNDSLTDEQHLLARVQWNLKFWKGFLQWNSFLETGAGLEPKREFTYIKVSPGQGQFSWYDYNGNGIQELGEFEVPPLADTASFIRVFTPTTEYISVSTEKITQQLMWSPAMIWSGKKGIQKWISYLSNQSSWQADRKTRNSEAFELHVFQQADTLTVFEKNAWNNRLLFQPGKWQLEWQHIRQFSSNTFVYGRDDQEQKSNIFQARIQNINGLRWQISYQESIIKQQSSALLNRNFSIDKQRFIQVLEYAFKTNLIATFNYEYAKQQNNVEGMEALKSQKFIGALELQSVQFGFFKAETGYIQHSFEGNSFSAVAYQMLEGLRAGKNITWALSWQKNMAKNLRASLRYEGRMASDIPVIHTGNIEMKVFF